MHILLNFKILPLKTCSTKTVAVFYCNVVYPNTLRRRKTFLIYLFISHGHKYITMEGRSWGCSQIFMITLIRVHWCKVSGYMVSDVMNWAGKSLNTLRLRQNCRHFADDILQLRPHVTPQVCYCFSYFSDWWTLEFRRWQEDSFMLSGYRYSRQTTGRYLNPCWLRSVTSWGATEYIVGT